MISHYQLLTIH